METTPTTQTIQATTTPTPPTTIPMLPDRKEMPNKFRDNNDAYRISEEFVKLAKDKKYDVLNNRCQNFNTKELIQLLYYGAKNDHLELVQYMMPPQFSDLVLWKNNWPECRLNPPLIKGDEKDNITDLLWSTRSPYSHILEQCTSPISRTFNVFEWLAKHYKSQTANVSNVFKNLGKLDKWTNAQMSCLIECANRISTDDKKTQEMRDILCHVAILSDSDTTIYNWLQNDANTGIITIEGNVFYEALCTSNIPRLKRINKLMIIGGIEYYCRTMSIQEWTPNFVKAWIESEFLIEFHYKFDDFLKNCTSHPKLGRLLLECCRQNDAFCAAIAFTLNDHRRSFICAGMMSVVTYAMKYRNSHLVEFGLMKSVEESDDVEGPVILADNKLNEK
jgi:hypothetical protein